jgi:hypothetical protein
MVIAMKAILVTALFVDTVAVLSNPLGKVLELLSALEAKIVKEGKSETAAYEDFFQWCDKTSTSYAFEVKSATRANEKLTSKIAELSSDAEVSTSRIEELVAATSTTETEMKDAASIRKKENIDFKASEESLEDTIDALGRALSMLSQQEAKDKASLAQIDVTSMDKMIQSLSAVVDAAGLASKDQSKLVAMLQGQHGVTSDWLSATDLGAPSAASYASHSSGITDVLEDLRDKAESSLGDARKAEASGRHNYEMVRQALEDQLAADSKDLQEQKAALASAKEEMATSEGDLAVTVKELAENKESLASTKSDCMTTAADHEATVKCRTQELTVLTAAKNILQESTGAAEKKIYSLLQVSTISKMQAHADLGNSELVHLLTKLAKDQHSVALNQLASRVRVVLQFSSQEGQSPFKKVRELLSSMIMKLEEEAVSESTEKEYCDDQMDKTETKVSDHDDAIAELTSKINKAASRSAALREDVVDLQSELATLTKSQAEMDKLRQSENAEYKEAKRDLEEGLQGVKKASQVLSEYYGGAAASFVQNDETQFSLFMQQPSAPQKHAKAATAGGDLLHFLEIVESDFATNLAKAETEESDAVVLYEKTTTENNLVKASKEHDVTYKERESAGLDKQISEMASDKTTLGNQAAAVNQYLEKLKKRCIAKPEAHEERKARRDAEIAGLKDALETFGEEAAFLQRKQRGHQRSFLGLH